MHKADTANKGHISLSREDAKEISRLLRLLSKGEDTSAKLIRDVHRLKESEREFPVRDSQQLIAVARRIYLLRRARELQFSPALFGEPAWDMLLALYATPNDDQYVSGLLGFSACPQTTALRYLSVLEDEGLIERSAHPTDRRVSRISLTGKGKASIEAYLATVMDLLE